MEGQMNLSHLSEDECQQILSVIQRDFNLRQQEKQRLEELEAEIKQEKLRSDILSKGQAFNENCCVRCFSQFYMFFNPKVTCVTCKYNVCKKCSVYKSKEKEYVCSLCTKQEELEVLSNKWFYSNVAERFDRFGSANVVRMIHKKKTESDGDSDSGYPPTDSSTFDPTTKQPPAISLIESTTEIQRPTDEREGILAKFRQRLDMIEKSIQQLHLQENNKELDGQSQFYQSSIKQNMTNVKTLLLSVARQLASEDMNSTDSDDSRSSKPVNHEQHEAISKRLLQEAVNQLYSSPSYEATINNGEEPFAFIDPAALTLDAYARRLSEAIFNKINEDIHCSNGEINEEDEEDLERQRHSNTVLSRNSQFYDSENEDLRATTDSMSDVDLREKVNFWPKSIDDQSRSESHSRMSINSSQNEFEEPVCFIESQDLTEKLAALNQSEEPSTSNQFSIESEIINDDKLINCPMHEDKQFLHQSDHENLSIHQSDDENQYLHQSDEEKQYLHQSDEEKQYLHESDDEKQYLHQSDDEMQSFPTLNQMSVEMNSPKLEMQNHAALYSSTETPEEFYDQNLKRKESTSTDSNHSTPVTRSLTTGDNPGDEEICSPGVLKYDDSEYEVTPDSLLAFTTRKKEMLVLPGLDDDDSISRLSDPELHLTSGLGSDRSYDTWSFRQVPMTLYDSFRRSKRSPNGSLDDHPSIFLPNKFPPEDPIIGDVNASELSDAGSLSGIDDDSDLDEDERKQLWYTESEKLSKSQKPKIPQDSSVQTEDIVFESLQSSRECGTGSEANLLRKNQIDSGVQTLDEADQLSFDSDALDFPDANEDLKPRFKDTPTNVIVSVGQSFRSKACLIGKKPLDVFWFHDTTRLDFDERCTIASKGNVYSLEMTDIHLLDNGPYVCIGVNEHGRCSHTFHVSIIDPDTFHQTEEARFKPSTFGQKGKHNYERQNAATKSSMEYNLSVSFPEVHSAPISHVETLEHENRSPANILPLLSDIVLPEIIATDVAMLPDDAGNDVISHDLVITNTGQQEMHDASSLEDDEDVFKTTNEMLQERTLISPVSITEEKVNLHLDQPSTPLSDPPAVSLSYLDHELMACISPDFEPSDGKVDLKLSFSDFEKLYESRIMTPSQLKSGRFTPEEVLQIQKILEEPHDETDTKSSEAENEETLVAKVFTSKTPTVQARLYGRDYVVMNDSIDNYHEKNLEQDRTSNYSVSSCDREISHDKSDDFHQNSSHDMQMKAFKHLMTSPADHQQQEFSYSRPHTADITSSSQKTVRKLAEPSGVHMPPTLVKRFPEDSSPTMSHHHDSATVSTSMQRRNSDGGRSDDEVVKAESSDLDELNLPSVKSLRMIFNAAPSTEESNFTRVYSLTARDLPNSAFAQKLQAKKDKNTRKQLLSLVSEPSGDEERKRYDSCSSRED